MIGKAELHGWDVYRAPPSPGALLIPRERPEKQNEKNRRWRKKLHHLAVLQHELGRLLGAWGKRWST